jgi:hypothetical protein
VRCEVEEVLRLPSITKGNKKECHLTKEEFTNEFLLFLLTSHVSLFTFHGKLGRHMNKAVYYTINNDSRYINYLKNSITSLRHFNKEIKVYVFVFSSGAEILADFFEKYKIQVIYKGNVKNHQLTSLKWYALRDLETVTESRLLYLDVDTVCFNDIALLFEKYREADLYAREELGTEEKCPYVRGELTISTQLDHNIFKTLADRLNVRKNHVLNTGVIIFNNSSFKRIIPYLDFYQNLLDSFLKREIPYPAFTYHITEEIAWAFTLGKTDNISYDFIAAEDSPFYIELRVKALTEKGIVMHVWSKLYNYFLSELGFVGFLD